MKQYILDIFSHIYQSSPVRPTVSPQNRPIKGVIAFHDLHVYNSVQVVYNI